MEQYFSIPSSFNYSRLLTSRFYHTGKSMSNEDLRHPDGCNDDEFTPHKPKPGARLLAYVNDTRRCSLLRALHLADIITEANCLCGVMSIFQSLTFCMINGPLSPRNSTVIGSKYLYRALFLIILGLICDIMDGRVARWRKKMSLMGQELDSLADLVSFGVAPAVVSFAWGLRTPIDQACLGFFVLCGLSRLARFNVSVNSIPRNKLGKPLYFEGTPIPTTVSIVALIAFFCYRNQLLCTIPLGTIGADNSLLQFHPFVILHIVSGLAMTSKHLRIPKL